MTPVSPELLENPPPGMINAYGSLLKLDPQDSLFLGSHDYELYESRLMMGICRPGDVAVDVGAMIGYYTLMTAMLSGPTGKAYAFEPDPSNFELLKENVAINDYTNVVLRQAVVGERTGRGKLFPAPEEFRGDARAFAIADREAIEIEVVALDNVIDEPVDLVKIDVQGYEAHVVAGMHELVARSKELALFLEFTPISLRLAGSDPASLLQELEQLEFLLFEIDEDAKRIHGVDSGRLMQRAEHGDLQEGYANLLCVKGQR